jgi:hypothetical protein
MEEIPIAAGLQIIDAHHLALGRVRERIHQDESGVDDSRSLIDNAFKDRDAE